MEGEALQCIKDFEKAYNETKNQPIYVNLENKESSNLQPTEQEEQIMKYQGKTIHKTKNNTWYTRFRANGKQYYLSAKTQKDCYNKLKNAIKKVNIELIASPQLEREHKGQTFLEWYNQWLDLYKVGKVKDTTINDYESSIKNLSEEIKNKEIKKITIIDVLDNLNKIKAERQRQKVYELLKMIFDKAVDNEILEKNIVALIDRPKHKKQNGRPLTIAEEQILIEKCKQIKYGDFYLVALYQGLRKGECLGITNEDIDFINNTLTINKAIDRHNKFNTTKNDVSVRTMPLFEKTKEILLKYKDVKGRIFNISYHRIDDYTKELNKLTSFEFSIKFMRYTFITRCAEQNIPEFVTQSWCGHEIGSRVTKRVYTKYNATDNSKYINIFNKARNYSKTTHDKK